jgi:putative transposase
MIYPIERNIHRPPHIYLDNTIYFIVSRTLEGIKYFNNSEKKNLLQDCLFEAVNKYGVKLYSWVILDNHYQIVIEIPEGKELSLLIKEINGKSSYLLNKFENKEGRKIWYQYREKIIGDENSFWTHINYNHHNPVKHGYVEVMEKYEWSSYGDYLKTYGKEFLCDCFENYPVIDYTPFNQ